MSWYLGILMILGALCAVMACERHGPVATTGPATVTAKPADGTPRLNARMTDDEMIRAFGLDPKSAKREFVQGKDGTSTTYAVADQRITVTRSVLSGITVTASGPVSGNWALGQP
jgi:hypothetical protein